MLFPRWTGERILPSRRAYLEYLRKYNGVRRCWISVYPFLRVRNNKPVIQSALINALYSPLIEEEDLWLLEDRDLIYLARFNGEATDLYLPLARPAKNLVEAKKLGSDLPFNFSGSELQLMLCTNTYDPRTGLYVVPVTPLDLPLDTRIAGRPRKVDIRGSIRLGER